MPDADLDDVADQLIGAGYGSAGERCMAHLGGRAGRRGDRRRARREAHRAGAQAQGRPLRRRRAPTSARWSDQDAVDRVNDYVQIGVDEGAQLVVDGRGFTLDGARGRLLRRRNACSTTSPPDMRIYKEEIFGPVLHRGARRTTTRRRCGCRREHEYGNGVAIFTRDGDTARDFTTRVQVGMVGVNVPIPVPIAYHTFGGWKALRLRRSQPARPGLDPVLHQDQDGHAALACRASRRDADHFVIPTMD